MSERVARIALPLGILLLLAVTVAWNPDLGLDIADADPAAGARLSDVLDDLPARPDVLVGFDADIGTYAEVRPTVRALLADLAGRGATLRLVSLTPEGRALAVAEVARLERLGIDVEIVDLGFIPGSEAALVELAATLADEGTDLAVVVGGNDIGPRSWVEQVAPRVDGLPIVAVTPVVLLPEVEPYRASGQLAALLATPRQGAAYRAAIATGAGDGPPATAMALGLLVAIAWLGIWVAGGSGPWLRSFREPERR